MSKALVELVRRGCGPAVLESYSTHGDETVVIDPARWLEVHRFLRDEPACQMNMLIDLCAVDYPDREPRFEVVCHLYSLIKKHRLRTKARDYAAFLKTAAAVLGRPGTGLWVTAEGAFADVRRRPVALKPGLISWRTDTLTDT